MSRRIASIPTTFTLAAGCLLAGACADETPIAPSTPSTEVAAVTAAEHGASPHLVDPNLDVRTVVSGLVTPIALAFLGSDDFLVLEKNTGRVKRVTGGTVVGTVLDLPVNSSSERGLLGIALAPGYPEDPSVYLYWTESSTGADSPDLDKVPLLGNRVDRFVWSGPTLTHASNVIRLRAFQSDANQPLRGNHDGGVIRFGPDGKLYVFIGDVGRRGWMQNLRCGPTDQYDCPPNGTVADDQFGGPWPDDAHLTGVVLRLNPDGSAPTDNPFYAAAPAFARFGEEVVANVRKIFSYGHRNSIGMDFDPVSGALWLEENGDDSFTELNRVEPGMNGGWVQIMGPVSRIAQFKEIETTPGFVGLQQVRWPAANIADTPAEALDRLFMLPGAQYSDPEFSWKWEVAPAGLGFIRGRALGPQYEGDLVVGAARADLLRGHLFRFNLTGNRRNVAVDDARLEDRVADNLRKHEITESESLLFGTDFGVGSDVQTGPNGNLYVVSLSKSSVYEIFRRR